MQLVFWIRAGIIAACLQNLQRRKAAIDLEVYLDRLKWENEGAGKKQFPFKAFQSHVNVYQKERNADLYYLKRLGLQE